MDLSKLAGPAGKKKSRRVGRGESSGAGKTCGKGHKGQNSRSGGGVRPGFEGGQMPLQRRLPKKGFNNRFRIEYNLIHVKDLALFDAGSEINAELLRDRGLVRRNGPIKLLSDGEVSQAYTIRLDRVSAAARAKVEAAGGQVEEL